MIYHFRIPPRVALFLSVILIWLSGGCIYKHSKVAFKPDFEPQVHKWFNGHTAALSITYDSGWPIYEKDIEVQKLIQEYGLVMDYEVVSNQMPGFIWDYIRDELLPSGLGVFGHGHAHINHDELSYASALESFSLNYELMRNRLGITPISYAYPGGQGYADSTTLALQEAGFWSARMHNASFHKNPYIFSADAVEPVDWFRLPSLVMQDITFENNPQSINNTEELIPFLEGALSRKAWLIKAYHAIGNPDGWGFYRIDEFEKGLEVISGMDFWVGRMDDITKYARQRERIVLDVDYKQIDEDEISITLFHDLDMQVFDHEMTISLLLPNKFAGLRMLIRHRGEILETQEVHNLFLTLNLRPSQEAYRLIFR